MDTKVFKRRVYVSALLVLFVSVLFLIKLFYLHFTSPILVPGKPGPDYRRGFIKDRDGYILAMSIETDSLFVNPEEMSDPVKSAKNLSGIVSIPSEILIEKFTREKRFVWIKRKLDDKTVLKIKRLGIKGLHFRKENKRVYPQGNLASNLTGFVGIDNRGLEGIEYYYDGLLSGMDSSGNSSEGQVVHGKNIILTIDRFIQDSAYKAIKKAVLRHSAKQGAIVILDVKSGRILAAAKYPDYNPNYYYFSSQEMKRNFTIIDSFEPGSTMKIISLASILENAPNTINSRYKCKGSIQIGDTVINCTGVHGDVGIPEIISHSCNVGIIEAAKKIKKEDLYSTLYRFGFGRKTGIELPGEADGILRPVSGWSGLSKYSMSFGNELSVTSIQLVAAFGAIANGGIYTVPGIIESIEDYEGNVIQEFYTRTKGRVVKKSIARYLMKMMRGVITKGTGKKAATAYYDVVGKTGTSKKFFRKGGYYSDRLVSSFIGIAPYKTPEICVLVVVDEPADRKSGGTVAAPAFADVVSRILPQMGVKKKYMKARLPFAAKKNIYRFDRVRMPDFRGMRLSSSVKLLSDIQKLYGAQYSFSGTGKVYAQSPKPGVRLKKGEKLLLMLR